GGIDHDRDGLSGRQRRRRGSAEGRMAGGVDQVDVHRPAGSGVVVDARHGDVERMAALFLDRVVVRQRVAALDRACRLDGAAGVQQGFEQGGLAGGGVACESHVPDVLRGVGHERTSPLAGIEGRHGCPRCAPGVVRSAGGHGGRPARERRKASLAPPTGRVKRATGGRSHPPACPGNTRVATVAFHVWKEHAMGISRHATAHWEGDLKTGKGRLSTPDSGLMQDTRYAFSSRFGDEKGTNPEELIAAAHAGCFTMALSAKLAEAGHAPTRLDTRADVDLSMEDGPALSRIRLKLDAEVPGIDDARFQEIATDAKENCPVSKALSAVPITLEAKRKG